MRIIKKYDDPTYEIYDSTKKSRRRKKTLLISIESMINRKDRKWFIKNLFENNSVRYSDFIQMLNALKDWSASYKLIEEEFSSRQITMLEREAFAFTDIIFRRFYPD